MKLFLPLAALALAPALARAQAPTTDQDQAEVKARVLQPIDVAANQDFVFGDIFRGAAKTINGRLFDQGSSSPGQPGTRGEFLIEASPDQPLTLTFTLTNPSLDGAGSQVLQVQDPHFCVTPGRNDRPYADCQSSEVFTSGVAYNLAPSGQPAVGGIQDGGSAVYMVGVGGTLVTTSSTPLGSYTGSLTLRAEYSSL